MAQAYYWHRFYAHQPDLNYDNPHVEKAVANVMRYWLDIGVDGMRLDAVPYLIEREGTINENLPETHALLKRLRRVLDERYGDRMLLAEANQWPEDVLQYFGEGDECHMAFHFPLMPRIFMAVAVEDRHPITDILRQTPDIPANCQWAVFLRNHDELTLEMVTDRERDYLWNHYAADKRMRLNLGIRRRLAPLLENDRRRMELLNGLMFSMPGTPVMYYGDEIGMGDNIFLGDRDGVRTPMQWSPDRNAGFSRADPAQLYLPPIMDAVYGYQSVNVEAQSRSPSSFLNWMKRLIAVRKARLAFGRGDQRFLYPDNRKVLAYLRAHGEEIILCVFNLARAPQAVELDLSGLKGRVPVELFGRSAFPPIGELPYLLTLPGHGFYWFLLDPVAETEQEKRRAGPLAGAAHHGDAGRGLVGAVQPAQPAAFRERSAARLFTAAALVRRQGRSDRQDDRRRRHHAAGAGQGSGLADHRDRDRLPRRRNPPLLPAARLDVGRGGERAAQRAAALHAGPRAPRPARGRDLRSVGGSGFCAGRGAGDGRGARAPGARRRRHLRAHRRFRPREPPASPMVKRIGGEQSNSSILIEEYGVLKLYRRLAAGVQPEIEVTRFLTDVAHFANTPPLLGACHLITESGEHTALGVLFAFLRNQGSAWAQALNYLTRYLDEALLMAPRETRANEPPTPEATAHPLYLELAAQLGLRTAELHRALCPEIEVGPDFAPELVTPADIAQWRDGAAAAARAMLANLARSRDGLPPPAQALADRLLDAREALAQRYAALLPAHIEALKTRFHGDYHLGQVLAVQNDFSIIDFEGEPLRGIAERRQKSSPLRDVAGMLRSYAYVAATAVRQMGEIQPAALPVLQERAEEWRRQVTQAFMRRYRTAIAGVGSFPADPAVAAALLDFFTLEKAVYEVDYELAQRPNWVAIPLAGVAELLEREGGFLE